MYLSKVVIENFRCFGEGTDCFSLNMRPGLTALVGENDTGKTAVIDALRFVLGTTDQEWYRLEDTDFREGSASREIRIVCRFDGLNARDKRAFVEYLTYGETGGSETLLYVNWTAKDTGEMLKGRPYRRVEVHSGKDGDGPSIVAKARELLRATYLRPLRDAEQALSAGRGSRLAQVLRYSDRIKLGENEYDPTKLLKDQALSVLGIADLLNALLETQKGVTGTRDEVDKNLEGLSLQGDGLKSDIKVSGATASPEGRLRELLEKLDMRLGGAGRRGLGSNNLLFAACELLLLAQEDEGCKLLLIEEPEAHLHAQRQLKVMKFMQQQAKEKGIQIIVTTHSPNLASAIDLDNIVMIRNGHAFPMANGETMLDEPDYHFLQRFLDVTKANLFFARGVMIVEGDAENILIPTLAKLLGRDFTEHGVSVVNVGGVGLSRYAKIFQRKSPKNGGQLDIPVACTTDFDVMPDCAPAIVGKLNQDGTWPDKRRWKAMKDFKGVDESKTKENLESRRELLRKKASGQHVQTFVSDIWTLEYDLAYWGFAEDVYVAAHLTKKEDVIDATALEQEIKDAQEAFAYLEKQVRKDIVEGNVGDCTYEELLASHVCAEFMKRGASKAAAAQYLAARLESRFKSGELTCGTLRKRLPKYLTEAIDYVTAAVKRLDAGPRAGEVTHVSQPSV